MPSHLSFLQAAIALATLPSVIEATIGFDCSNVVHQNARWNLKALGGPRAVHWLRPGTPSSSNFTFTLDICKPLLRHKGVPADDECVGGTNVCGIDYLHNSAENVTTVAAVANIAGHYIMKTGKHLESEVTRLKGSGSSADANKDGLRVVLSGGTVPLEKGGLKQKAVIEFFCDPNRDGTETEMPAPGDIDDGDDKESSLQRRADGDDKKETPTGPLSFLSYETEHDEKGAEEGTLRLKWSTKYACEDAINDPVVHDGSHWGFFTWLIIIVFLAVAAYLIFGSWLNYNRYGARGWDLIPHGDAIRDIPYVMKDIGRRVATTVQGPGTRGGYSAV